MSGLEREETRLFKEGHVFNLSPPMDHEELTPQAAMLGEVYDCDGSSLPFAAFASGKRWHGSAPLKIELESEGFHPDIMFAECFVPVLNQRAEDILRPLVGSSSQLIPAVVVGHGETNYFVLNALSMPDAIDERLSGVTYLPDAYYAANPSVERRYHTMGTLVFRSSTITAPLFRIRMSPSGLFARQDFREVVIANDLSGVVFRAEKSV